MKNRARSKKSAGSALTEFAVSVPMIALAFAGCFQFGYYFFVYDRLEAAVRAGARYASIRNYNSSTSTPADSFSTAVKNMVVYGSPDGGTSPVVSGLTTSNVNLSVTFVNNMPSEMTVSITGVEIDTVFKKFTLSGKPVATFRYGGKLSPAL